MKVLNFILTKQKGIGCIKMNKEEIKNYLKPMIELVRNKKCPFCKKDMENEYFRDKLSIKEYTISGLCQDCQDEMFGK